jgi:hypothetical protein
MRRKALILVGRALFRVIGFEAMAVVVVDDEVTCAKS